LAPKGGDEARPLCAALRGDLDLRPNRNAFGKSYGADLTAENRRMMYVPKGFAHGFITLEDATEALYLVDEFYGPEQERGVRFDDAKFSLSWPLAPVVVSDKDRAHRDFEAGWHLGAAP
jgi:dTDP-4-dehydrorhamnose 3,5-epimerase